VIHEHIDQPLEDRRFVLNDEESKLCGHRFIIYPGRRGLM
jgi:hypothetical protein